MTKSEAKSEANVISRGQLLPGSEEQVGQNLNEADEADNEE